MKKTLLIVVFLIFVIKAYCLPPPSLNPPYLFNAILLNNGDVVLIWNKPPDPDSIFDSYHIYSSDSISGPFIKIDSIFNYFQTTKTCTGLGQKYFYMTTRDTNNRYSLSSDTLQSFSRDAGVTAIIEPHAWWAPDTLFAGMLETVKITIKNFGPSALVSMPLSFSVNGQLKGTGIWNGSLLPNDTSAFVFIPLVVVPSGYFTICAKTNLPYDANPSNDSICKSFFGWTDISENTFNQFKVLQNIPNPAQGVACINYYVPANDKVEFSITNLMGQPVCKEIMDAVTGMNSIYHDFSDTPAGVYLYSIKYKEQTITKRLVVVK